MNKPSGDDATWRMALLELAETLGNVAEACRRFSVTRKTYYKLKQRYDEQGKEGLRNRSPIAKSHPRALAKPDVERIRVLALTHPAYGCDALEALLLRSSDDPALSSSVIQKYLIRLGLATRRARWLALEDYAKDHELSEIQETFVAKYNPCFRERKRLPASCGVLLSQDVQLLGRVDPVGQIYLHSVVDHYSGYAFATLYGAKRPEAAIALLYERVFPYYERFDIKPMAIQTHTGREFCGGPSHPFPLYLRLNGIEHRTFAAGSSAGSGFTERLLVEAKQNFWKPAIEAVGEIRLSELQLKLQSWLKNFVCDVPFDGFPNNGKPPILRMPSA